MKMRVLGLLCMASVVFVSCDKEGMDNTLKPYVDFSYSPEEIRVGDEVLFKASAEPGSSEIVSWNWDFGQGSSSQGKDVSFVYGEAGNYKVILTAVDILGVSVEESNDITVLEEEGSFSAEIAWSFNNGTDVTNVNDGSSAPAIGDDGTVYYLEGFAGALSTMVAVVDQNTSGQKKWEYGFGANARNAPSIGPDGSIYTSAWLGDAVFKFNKENGNVLWQQTTGSGISNSTTAISSNGDVYVGTRSQGVYGWSSDGTLLWHHESADGSKTPFYSSPVLGKDESTLYILMTATAGEVWAFDAMDGSPKWNEPVAVIGSLGSSLSIDGDGTVYVTTDNGVIAITDNGSDGAVKWFAELEGAGNSGIVIGPEGDLYTGASSGLVSLNPMDGSLAWTYPTSVKESVPAVDINGNIYIGSVDGKFHIVDPLGEALKIFELGDNTVNSPTIADDGSIYVEAVKNFQVILYKILVEDSGPADSPWPMKGQNRMNTGRAL
ncbi:outer membrane protein assembly factor BamB family protein [Flagellimonas olearia]|nr:PQQ-binding-like beta-propeller repeat protein [Allomuricauda olearia]